MVFVEIYWKYSRKPAEIRDVKYLGAFIHNWNLREESELNMKYGRQMHWRIVKLKLLGGNQGVEKR